MGASAKKKKEKKQDFQKPKLKVGKAKAKVASFTDTSFKSKAITVNQNLPGAHGEDGPLSQFKHHLSQASSSRSETQRSESLSYLTSQLSSNPPFNPVGSLQVLLKVLPLVSDGSKAVRSQLLKLLRALPAEEVKPYVEKVILYVRAGMTNLSNDISEDSMSVLEWLLETAAAEVVSAPGCWVKPLSCFVSVLRWSSYMERPSGKKGWTAAPQGSLGSLKKKQAYARQLIVLGKFLEAGFAEARGSEGQDMPLDAGEKQRRSIYCVPREPNAFAHLNVFGSPRDEDGQMYMDRESRQGVFMRKFYHGMGKGVEEAKKEGGAIGRAANGLEKVLNQGLEEYETAMQGDFGYSVRGLMALW